MKILFVLEHFFPYIGGAEKLFYELSTKLANKGYEIIVITTQFDKNLPLVEMHKGIKIVRVRCKNRYAFTFLSLPKIIQYAKDCDLIHTTTYNAAIPAIIGGKIRRKKVFVTFHEVWGKLWKQLPFTSFVEQNVFYLFEKILLNLPFDKFIAVSKFTASELVAAGIPERKIMQIYNGIEYEVFANFSPQSPNLFTFTYFGRLGISKGLDLLIPAAAKFKLKYPNARMKLIIPKEPKAMYSKLKSLISTHGLDDYIDILNNLSREDLYKELLASSCIVIPSYSEGFCFAAAETVALNIPIISSHKGALQEVVSGKFIRMEEQSSAALYKALIQAYLEDWTNTEIKYYHLNDSIKLYEALYNEYN